MDTPHTDAPINEAAPSAPAAPAPPDSLGGDTITPEAWAKIPAKEQAAILAGLAAQFAPRYWECYIALRVSHPYRQAIAGAWAATGKGGRGKRQSLTSLADMLGVDRRTLQRYLHPDTTLAKEVAGLRANYWADRIPDIDEATYMAATSIDGTAADRKLAYQRAGVIIGEDGSLADDWLDALNAARAEADAGSEEDQRAPGDPIYPDETPDTDLEIDQTTGD